MQACSGNLCAKFHTLSFINNWEKSEFGKGQLVEICVLSKIHASNARFRQINAFGNLCAKFHTLSFINNWEKRFTYRFFKFSCESLFTRKRNPSHDLLSSFLTLIRAYQYLWTNEFFETNMMNHVLQNFSWESNALMALLALTCTLEWL